MADEYRTLKFKIEGIAPLMMHNGQLADPLNGYTRQLKAISAKRKKTDADHEAMADVEWEGGLYLSDDKRVIVPMENIEAMMIEAARKDKLGEQFKAGILCEDDYLLEYDGPKDIEKLKADPRFRDRRGVRVQQSRVMRTRPIFRPWALKFELKFLPDVLNETQVREAVAKAGRLVGLGEFTPKYGRFLVA